MTGPTPQPERQPTRREFLAASALGGAAILAGPGGAFARPQRPGDRPKTAKNLILLVADGMSVGTLTLTDLFLTERLGSESRWMQWLRSGEARRSLVATESANSLVTDSAAAASAWSTGDRYNNGAICVTPAGASPEPLWHRVRRSGRSAGVVTTARVTHATPAAFYANQLRRDDEGLIAKQLLERGLDIALGGGANFVTPELLAAHPGVRAVATRDELLALTPGDAPICGVFSKGHMAFEIDRLHDPEIQGAQPTLAEMSRVALDQLSRGANGFALMIEGGRVDHCAHNSDASILYDQWAFDDALGLALEFAAARDDTLVIATTDHGNANPGLSSYGRAGREAFQRTQDLRRSFEWVFARFGALPRTERSAESLASLVTQATSRTLDADDMTNLARWLAGERVDPCNLRCADYCPLGSIMTNHHGVAFLSSDHTADHVELAASGPGAERIPAFLHLSDLSAVMAEALELEPAPAL